MKITNLTELAGTVAALRKNGLRVGFVSGCFDVLHIGHIELFRFAKEHVDTLVVGIDNDRSIRLSKGESRPVHPEKMRLDLLSELRSIDYVFVIEDLMVFGGAESYPSWDGLLTTLKPSTIITHELADSFASNKKALADKYGFDFIAHNKEKTFSTTSIHKLFFECY